MKAIVQKGKEPYERYLEIFGTRPVLVEPAPPLNGKPRVRVVMNACDDEQKLRWRRHCVIKKKMSSEQAALVTPTFFMTDVTVIEELFP